MREPKKRQGSVLKCRASSRTRIFCFQDACFSVGVRCSRKQYTTQVTRLPHRGSSANQRVKGYPERIWFMDFFFLCTDCLRRILIGLTHRIISRLVVTRVFFFFLFRMPVSPSAFGVHVRTGDGGMLGFTLTETKKHSPNTGARANNTLQVTKPPKGEPATPSACGR